MLSRCTFGPPGSIVTCAVSGGADSMTLLHLAVAAGLQVTAVHVDHGLRDNSADEAHVVAAHAARIGAEFRSERVHLDRHAGNLEARARQARYAVLPPDVLTGHTMDDQAETVLINLLRGAAAAGLAAMTPGPRRPLLGLRRSETTAFCQANGIAVVSDPSNNDPAFLRNRVRHELLPNAAALAGRDLVPVLARQADVLRDDDELLDELASTLDATDAKALVAAPRPLARRAVRQWLTTDHPPDLATVERVLAVAAGDAIACELPGGDRVQRSQQRLRRISRDEGASSSTQPNADQ